MKDEGLKMGKTVKQNNKQKTKQNKVKFLSSDFEK